MIRLIFLVVFLGWIVIWILLPTKVYKNTWTPKLESKLNSTYFEGEGGNNLLLFSFPVMFIAAFGSVYLHFQKELRKPTCKSAVVSSNRLSFLKRPLLVMAPLGIVTAMEIAFAAMFIALLIWSLANYLYVSFGHLHMHKQGEKIWQAKFRSVSLRLGYIGNICWAFLFFPVTRGSSILPLVGLTSESSIKYHIWVGHLSMILFAAHAVGFIIYWAMTNQMAEMLEWSKTWVSNVAGEIAIVVGLAIYLRFLQSRQRARLLSSRLLPCGTIELNFSKSRGPVEMSVEGPYGPISSHFLRHELLVMVGGGSGVTPFISIIRQIIFQSTQPDSHIPRILLVCAFKNSGDLAILDLLLPINGTTTQITQLQLQIEAYITREEEQPIADTKKLLQTIRFKPNQSDSPITAALGPNNWLWLGAVITSSFVMFLLLLGIVTRYYIYPIDHNTGEIYHFSYFVLWDLLLVCASIVIASGAAFLWCKKQNGVEKQQIENLEVPNPTASPGSDLYSADTELESVPHQSLVQATNVHFGARPDLKRILFECKGSDVGVLACGPKAMRHEVAKICSSGLADNLHFESISFDW
uniref:ferric-chelate reductase (NADH) n=1 Tax=Manihot esculenta TaxID=3983 RepID=A0A2C9VR10_MANES